MAPNERAREAPNERVREADRAPREARGESEAGVSVTGESEAEVSKPAEPAVSGEIHPQAARLPGARGTLLRLASEFREHGNNDAQDIYLVLESEANWKWTNFVKDTRISKLEAAVQKLCTAAIELDNGYHYCRICKFRWHLDDTPCHANGCLLLDAETVMTTASVKTNDIRSGYPRDLIESLSKNAAYGKEDNPVSVPAYTSEEIAAAPPGRRQYMAFSKRAAPIPPDDPVNHPRHYTSHPSGVECIDIIEDMSLNLGNAVKYLFRREQKHAEPLLDLRKSLWYITREYERRSSHERRHERRGVEDFSVGCAVRSVNTGSSTNEIDRENTQAGTDQKRVYDDSVLYSDRSHTSVCTSDSAGDVEGRMPPRHRGVTPGWGSNEQQAVEPDVGNTKVESSAQGSAQDGLQWRAESGAHSDVGRGTSGSQRIQRASQEAGGGIQGFAHGHASSVARAKLAEKVLSVVSYEENENIRTAMILIWRVGLEGGGSLRDLKKARRCVEDEIERVKALEVAK